MKKTDKNEEKILKLKDEVRNNTKNEGKKDISKKLSPKKQQSLKKKVDLKLNSTKLSDTNSTIKSNKT